PAKYSQSEYPSHQHRGREARWLHPGSRSSWRRRQQPRTHRVRPGPSASRFRGRRRASRQTWCILTTRRLKHLHGTSPRAYSLGGCAMWRTSRLADLGKDYILNPHLEPLSMLGLRPKHEPVEATLRNQEWQPSDMNTQVRGNTAIRRVKLRVTEVDLGSDLGSSERKSELRSSGPPAVWMTSVPT